MLELSPRDISLEKNANNKEEAILNIAKDLVEQGFVVEGYENGMLAREKQNSTFLGNGIAIPHGTTDTRNLVKQTGVQIHHFPQGVDWGDGQRVYLAIGIAAKSDEHLSILKQLTRVLSDDGVEEALKNAKTKEAVLAVLNGKAKQDLRFDEALISLEFPASDLLSLTALSVGKLFQAGVVSSLFVSELLESPALCLGQGVWVVSSDKGVKQTALSFVGAATPFVHEGKDVKGLFVLAACGFEYAEILKNLAVLLFNRKTEGLFSHQNALDLIKSLTAVSHSGLTRIFKIQNEHGLHARPGAMLVNAIKPFEAKVWVSNLNGDGKQVNAKSLMKVIALGVKKGHELEFIAEGADAKEALDSIDNAINNGLGEGH